MTRVVLATCATWRSVGRGLVAMFVALGAVNKPPGNRHLAIVIPFLAPLIPLWLIRAIHAGSRDLSLWAVTMGAAIGLFASYETLQEMRSGKAAHVRLASDDRFEVGITAGAVFVGAFLGTYRRRKRRIGLQSDQG